MEKYRIDTPLTIYSALDYPENGWNLDDKIILPPNAFPDKKGFILHALTIAFQNEKERFLSMFSGNLLHIHRLEEKAVYLIVKMLNEKSLGR